MRTTSPTSVDRQCSVKTNATSRCSQLPHLQTWQVSAHISRPYNSIVHADRLIRRQALGGSDDVASCLSFSKSTESIKFSRPLGTRPCRSVIEQPSVDNRNDPCQATGYVHIRCQLLKTESAV
jgi:hypothetical protein